MGEKSEKITISKCIMNYYHWLIKSNIYLKLKNVFIIVIHKKSRNNGNGNITIGDINKTENELGMSEMSVKWKKICTTRSSESSDEKLYIIVFARFYAA